MAEKFEQENSFSEEDFAHFIGKNADKYLPKFRKFSIDGVDKFSVTWNWSAVFFTYIWLAYRRMYLWAAFCLLLYYVEFMLLAPVIHPGEGGVYPILIFLSALIVRIVLMTAFGIVGNYLYYKRAKLKITKWKGSDMAKPLPKVGGVSYVACILAVGVILPLEILHIFAFLTQLFGY